MKIENKNKVRAFPGLIFVVGGLPEIMLNLLEFIGVCATMSSLALKSRFEFKKKGYV